ncbi:MAG: hypothetical protein H6603_00330 [Flavobacteriales bacterium]|nr:hypothetical protein [Flavobacteriales bacterium]MCB9203394.1 hypothetical protein [Flavobacteriales bacterium]
MDLETSELSFTVLVILSFGFGAIQIARLFNRESKSGEEKKKSSLYQSNSVTILILCGLVIFSFMTTSFKLSLLAIAFGFCWGGGYVFIHLGAKKVWGRYKKEINQRHFDKLDRRPENLRRKTTDPTE